MYSLIKSLLLGLIASTAWAHTGNTHDKLIPATETLQTKPVLETFIKDGKRVFHANGIPNHTVALFPNSGNPHQIAAQDYRFAVSANPSVAKKPSPLIRQPFGIALNGVLFDPGTAEYYQKDRSSEWNYEALSSGTRPLGLDENHAHVQPNGAYHYHGIPTALFKALKKNDESMTLLGWAADGFPIYGVYGHKVATDATSALRQLTSSYQLKQGKRPSGSNSPGGAYDGSFTLDYKFVEGSGDLDECGGRYGVTPEFPAGTYYYVLTDDYPFIPRMFRGTPDPSFNIRGNRNRRGAPHGATRPPPLPTKASTKRAT